MIYRPSPVCRKCTSSLPLRVVYGSFLRDCLFFQKRELQVLNLHEAGVTGDLSAVSGMTQLTQLDLDSTAVYLLR